MENNMKKIVVRGKTPLTGNVTISAMKNAALPIIFACVLVKDKCTIENIPNVRDVLFSFDILSRMGAEIRFINDNTVEIDCSNVEAGTSSYELVRQMRASYYLMGAEFGRFGYARVGLPGGCDFGGRPIDQHIKGFEALGGDVKIEDGYVEIKRSEPLKGAEIFFDMETVGATINIMLASVISEGLTVIDNAAKEPHIVDLANFLNTCGAKIRGAGTDMIKVHGVRELHGCTYAIIPDMIEAGTYMIAAAVTKGCVTIENVIPKHLESVSKKLVEMGVDIEEYDDSVKVDATNCIFKPTKVKTLPYPGFPTDMQPQMSVILTQAEGVSSISEGVYEDKRFRYVEELARMGADIIVQSSKAIINGCTPLHGAKVQALDLRAGVAMIIAGLVAEGETEISEVYRIERGYDDIVGKLTSLGADVKYVDVPDEE